MNKSGIVTIGNSSFFPGILALINSIRCNSPMPITIIDEGFTDDQRGILKNMDINLIKVQRSIPINSERFVCCYAFFDIDQAPYDTIVYLDADTIVLQNISELAILALKSKVVCSYANPAKSLEKSIRFNSISEIIKKIGRKAFLSDLKMEFQTLSTFYKQFTYPQLNTGVVAIRKETLIKIKNSLPKYSKYFSIFKYPDQDLFSLLLAEYGIRPRIIPYLYNATRLHCHPFRTKIPRSWQKGYYENIVLSIKEGKATIIKNKIKKGCKFKNEPIYVLHFNTAEKPWHAGVILREGFKELWEFYYNLYPYSA